jgi:DNA polymerase-3 subunit alpha
MIHLHVHSDGSVFDGEGSVKRIVKRAKELNMPAIALTDHGSMIKNFEFQKQCDKEGIKAIHGCEFYVGEPDTENTYHLICLAKNNTGLKNLYKLNAFAYTKNFYRKPRITFDKLVEHREGLIVLTACTGGELGQAFINYTESLPQIIRRYQEVFGDDFYLELQPNTIPVQKEYNKALVRFGQQLGVPLVVTTDAHYAYPEDYKAHDVMLAMQVGKKVNDPSRFKFQGTDYYIMDEDEVYEKLLRLGVDRESIARAINNTSHIADKCNARIETGLNLLPSIGVSDEFRTLCEHVSMGHVERVNRGDCRGDRSEIERVQYELSVIKQKGYAGYFLIVEDFISWAKSQGIYVGVGRGSAGGSMVAYLLGIHNVNPLKYGLLFERFTNPERNSVPDIDSDFCYERREEVIQYVLGKYGHDKVAHIIAEGTMTCKAVCRRVLGTYDYDQKYINQIAKTIPDELNITLKKAYDQSEEFRHYMDLHREEYEVMLQLEGLMSHISKHAAGIAICSKPIDEVIPCMSDSEDRTMLMSQWHKKIIEEIGIYKFDFLGLKTLTLIRKTVEAVKRNHNIDIDIDKIDLSDPIIYQVLNSGDLSGVFQFDAPAGKQTIEAIKPTCFDDVIAGEALCRPGVKERELYLRNKSGKLVIPVHPIIDEILKETYGAIVYQEQTMLIMNRLTGGRWSLGKADSMRKVKNLEDYREDFVASCVANGVDSVLANIVFDRFSMEYAFNKSHATSYAVISVICSYLKGKFYKEFMASLMSIELLGSDGGTNIPIYVKEAKRKGIKIIPPDINTSRTEFFASQDAIEFPLTAIKNVGKKAVEVIMSKRPFTSLSDFVARVPKSKANKRVVENLVKAGAFDNIDNKNRNILLKQFTGEEQLTWSKEIGVRYETELMGISLTGHPLDSYNIVPFTDFPEGTAYLTGIVMEVKKIIDRSGNEMAFVKMENQFECIETIVFARTFSRHKKMLLEGMKLRVSGRKEGNKMLADLLEVI